jgi:adenylyltransferase/sulfurtransferase
MQRYHRQILLPQIGTVGQQRLLGSRVLLIGCGALGSVIAEQLARAGVGFLRIIDRDIVELTNLQRQVLFDESDGASAVPKAVAAANRLARVNSSIRVEPIVADVDARNIEELIDVDLILDGTDNVATRYLINDVSVKHATPWVYGACVGTEGRVMTIRPERGPCLRCVFPEPPAPGELPTCDTAGVLGPVASVIGSMQAIAAIKLLTASVVANELISMDLWKNRIRVTDVADAKRESCPTCGLRRFEFLSDTSSRAVQLCGREAVQVRAASKLTLSAPTLAARLDPFGEIQQTPYFVRCDLRDEKPLKLTVFLDGRTIVHGTNDPARAKAIHAKYVGA